MEPFITKHAIFIGGHPSLALLGSFPIPGAAENSFLGCLGDIHINGKLCDPRKMAFVGDVLDGYGIGESPIRPK